MFHLHSVLVFCVTNIVGSCKIKSLFLYFLSFRSFAPRPHCICVWLLASGYMPGIILIGCIKDRDNGLTDYTLCVNVPEKTITHLA